jgi:hypothetical protein
LCNSNFHQKSSNFTLLPYQHRNHASTPQEKTKMIERNIGNAERVTRLAVGLLFGAAALSRPTLNGGEWVLIVLFIALVLNGIFSRCYVWYLLDIDTTGSHDRNGSRARC